MQPHLTLFWHSLQDLIVYTVICVCDVGSLALCMVLGLVSLYYLIIIKLQESVYFLMVRDGDLHNFRSVPLKHARPHAERSPCPEICCS